jgi:hypothetical protein
MGQAVAGNRLLYRALLASLAIHIVVIALIPPLAQLSGTQSVQTLSFVRIVQVQIRTPEPPPHELPAMAPVRAAVPRVSRVRRAASAIHAISRTIQHATPQPQRAPLVAAAEPGGSMASQGSGTTVTTPSSTPNQNNAGEPARQEVGGYMPLGADEPTPVLDPAVRKALVGLGVHVTLTVTVDSTGRTEDVSFEPPLDQGVEQQIRSMLASASWDPAVCGGGVTCEGQATIKL